MQPYRLFIFDRFGKKVDEQREFQANKDSTAVDLSEGWRQARKAELWCGDRQVHSWVAGRSA